jgi:CelD/BcsL family acetyltransferase involved in cellulose biosynthesis
MREAAAVQSPAAPAGTRSVAALAGRTSRISRTDTRYQVRVDRGFDVSRWRELADKYSATAFQSAHWLETWYATFGRHAADPLLVTITDRKDGALAAALALVRRAEPALRALEFADAGVSDYNAPILGPAAPTDPADARSMWTALRSAIPGVDLVRFTKMPREVEGRVNPFVLLSQAHAGSFSSNAVSIEGNWEAYLASLERVFRKELRRYWRVFEKHEGAHFRQVTEPDEAARVFAELERQQCARRREAGLPYVLDQPEFAAFYRKLTADGIPPGDVVLTALMCGEEVVAALLGITRKDRYVMVRISSGSREWANCSPGRLVIVQTMRMLHERGYKVFDFSIGNYDYKRRLGVVGQPLCDFVVALSPRGLPSVLYDRAGRFVRSHSRLNALVHRLRGPGAHKAADAKRDD